MSLTAEFLACHHNIKLYNGNIHLSTTVFGISQRLAPVWGSMKSFLTWCGLWCHSKSWKKTNNKQRCSHADCKDRQLQYAGREKDRCPFPGPLVICSTPPPPPPPTQTHTLLDSNPQWDIAFHSLCTFVPMPYITHFSRLTLISFTTIVVEKLT